MTTTTPSRGRKPTALNIFFKPSVGLPNFVDALPFAQELIVSATEEIGLEKLLAKKRRVSRKTTALV